MKRHIMILVAAAAVMMLGAAGMQGRACTGIGLTARDGSRIVARTVEWAAEPMKCGVVVTPRGHLHRALTPSGANGLQYTSRYGYVGIYTEYEPFVVEGVNESGLSAGLFFFPGYGEFDPYCPEDNDHTLNAMEVVSWILSQFSSIDQVRKGLKEISLVSLDHRIGAVHWRIAEPGGRQVVLEVVNGIPRFYENPVGVLTNAPGFPWHLTNLNNYINIAPGDPEGAGIFPGLPLRELGHGSGLHGVPGDNTSPSRFVRAAILVATAPPVPDGRKAVLQAFHLLNQFDIPVGTQHLQGAAPEGLPSATQVTVAVDQKGRKLYYRTAWNSNIRCIELHTIDFRKVKHQTRPLDKTPEQPVEICRF